MRRIITKRNSTKSERIFAEALKDLHIPFRHRVKISGYEVDFVIGNKVIEIDGHSQNVHKNEELVKAGYVPLHFTNYEVHNYLRERIKQCL